MNELRHLLQMNPFNRIMFGLVLMVVGHYAEVLTGSPLLAPLPFILTAWYLVISAFRIIPHKRIPFQGYYKILYVIYVVVIAVMIFRGFISENRQYDSLKGALYFYLVNPYVFSAYFVPLVVFIPKEYFSLRLTVKYAAIIGVLSILVVAVSFDGIVVTSFRMAAGLAESMGDITGYRVYESFTFVALCSMYLTKKQWLCNILGLITLLFITLIFARRGDSLSTSCILMLSLFFWARSKKSFGIRMFLYAATILVMGLIVFQALNSDMFVYLQDRGLEDSRTGVEEALIDQMTEKDMWFGKGLNGRYWMQITAESDGWRYGCETGFYHYVLKGGYLMVGLHIILLFIPAIKGVLKSKNFLCRMGGVYILLSLFELYPFGIFHFNTKYFIIWMMASICMSKEWRKMSDEEIKARIF